MALADIAMCTCPASFEPVICAKCGGKLLSLSQIFSKIDMSLQQWFYDLDSESRLNSTLGTYMAIDKQRARRDCVSDRAHSDSASGGGKVDPISSL